MRKQLFALAALVLSAAATHAAPIATTVSTDGNGYQGELSLLNDGRSVAAVGWNGLGKVFTFEFDDLYRIDNVSLAVRRGGDYRLEFSTDAKDWGRLLTVPGVVTDGGSGIVTVSTDPADADYVRELLFAPAEARYVRISADKASGDKTAGRKDAPFQYAIAEVAFSGERVVATPLAQASAGLAPRAMQVPEPTALALVAVGLAGLGLARRRRGRA